MGCSKSKEQTWVEKAEKCDHCDKKFKSKELKHGQTLPNGKRGVLHDHCVGDWKRDNVDKCDECQQPMMDGVLMMKADWGEAKVHDTCSDKYKERKDKEWEAQQQ